jgi:hypothetical protein
MASTIPQPHTTESIKAFLCNLEKISNVGHTILLATPGSDSKLGDQDDLDILTGDGLGSVREHPIALIIGDLPPVSSSSQLFAHAFDRIQAILHTVNAT